MGPNSNSLDACTDAVPKAERRPILLRAYPKPIREPPKRVPSKIPDWTLIFDTETLPDETQQLRIGTFQLLNYGKLEEKGIFYGRVEPAELDVLKAEAPKHGCTLRSVHDFIHKILLPAAFKAGGWVVGFNLPFDLSRLAIAQTDARVVTPPRTPEETESGAPKKAADRSMVGGFSFTLSPYDDQPHLIVKHLDSRSAFYRFAKPAHQDAAKSQRKRGRKPEFQRGNFLDLKTLSAALTSTSHTLDSLAKYLDVKHKGDFKDFERVIDPEFIDYAVNDTAVTRQCFEGLVRRYAQHRLRHTPPHRIYSEAGLGKAYLEEMGIKPWREAQKHFDPAVIGAIMSSYFGGRAEVHFRRTVTPSIYCDFASMYPTVCTLMQLWRFVIGEGIDQEDSTEQTRKFLDVVDLDDLQKPETWTELTTLVQVLPDEDIFPVRARYAARIDASLTSTDMPTIGLNYLSADRRLWFTLADCVSSKLLTGKAPNVVRALRFKPKSSQAGLRTIRIAGNPEFLVEPTKDDFYKRVIEMRLRVKERRRAAKRRDPNGQEVKNLDMDQLALKILANATSYGIFIELNVEDADERDDTFPIHTSQGTREVKVSKREQPGRFYHPLLATLITGAARLMLALTERLAFANGLNWAFCDTDSMAFANSTQLPFEEFVGRVRAICNWFAPLNPYDQDNNKPKASILELEDQNFQPGRVEEQEFEPLFCFAISAKRYALFNLDDDGNPVIRKASAHGLGHIVAPYGDDEEARSERDNDVRLWEEEVWIRIITAALGGTPQLVDYAYRSEMSEPARSRYSATRPAVLDWFKSFNASRPYPEQVKPFNFMLSFFARRQEDLMASDPERDWDRSLEEIRPVAPFSRDIAKALPRIFDRNSDPPGKPVPREWLRTVSDVLRDYHRQPEYKFLGGGWNEEGVLRRRHVFAETIEDIGKETDGWEEDDARTEDEDTVLIYPSSSLDRERMIERIKSVGKRELMREARIRMSTINAAWAGQDVAGDELKRMANAAERIDKLRQARNEDMAAAVVWLKAKREDIGLVALAKLLEVDAANLAKIVSGRRRHSKLVLQHIRRVRPQI